MFSKEYGSTFKVFYHCSKKPYRHGTYLVASVIKGLRLYLIHLLDYKGYPGKRGKGSRGTAVNMYVENLIDLKVRYHYRRLPFFMIIVCKIALSH